jgi:hypothetical protein
MGLLVKRTTDQDAAEFERLADLVAGDLDPETFRVRPGRPSISSLPLRGRHSPQIATRVSADVRIAFVEKAAEEGRTPSEVLRDLIAGYVTGPGSRARRMKSARGR